MSAQVIELVTFKIKDGINRNEFVKAAEATWPVVQQMNGYVDRKLTVDETGQWRDIVYWTDLDAAQAAAAAVMQIPEFGPFGSMIDEREMVMMHLDVVAG